MSGDRDGTIRFGTSEPGAIPVRRDVASAAWFDALAEGRLLLRSCPAGHVSRPDVLSCDVCGDGDLGWAESAGRGVVAALAVDHAQGATLVVVELDEGPWLATRVDGPAVGRGAEVVVVVERPADGEPYPVARAVD